jgi:hypothetical protein
MNRRTLLIQLLGLGGAALGAPALANSPRPSSAAAAPGSLPPAAPPPGSLPPAKLPFQPVRGPIPLASDGLSAAEQRQRYGRLSLEDRLVLPEGYRSELLLRWGDRLGEGRFGFNNDYLAFLPIAKDRALLTVNFEYISARPWCAGYEEISGEVLPFQFLAKELARRGNSVDLASLAAADPLRQPLLAVASAAMADLGIGVAELRRDASGSWRHHPGRLDRRLSGLTGWQRPEQLLRSSGPAAAVFRRQQRLGYNDGLGDRVIGTFANCAGGQTPWGTVLSAEENIQTHVVEAVYADGSSPSPAERPFSFDGARLEGLGNPFGLAGNKYGWMVEIDPRQPQRPAVKHSWLGRYRHEAVAVKARAAEPLVVYSGCDRHGGHLYRFVSAAVIRDPQDGANSRLLEQGRLEVAQFQPDGSGRWIPLSAATPLAPVPPSHYGRHGLSQACLLPHSDRRRAGAEALQSDQELQAYLGRYRRLADLYPGGGETQMGAILIDAHLAANAVGATATARPEDTELDPVRGDLLITFTAGGSDGEGRADPAIFRGPAGESSWPYGWVMRLEDGPAAASAAGGNFRWRMVATGGTPWQGGLGFANPDNLAIDRRGNVWLVTDRSTSSSELDVFGNNSCWLLPASGTTGSGTTGSGTTAAAGADPAGSGTTEALLFATGPMECELTGPCFDADETTLFLAVQHPGEDNAAHQPGREEFQAHQLQDRDGRPFEQLRRVPLGSNWPSGAAGRTPRPAVVAIRRNDGAALLG